MHPKPRKAPPLYRPVRPAQTCLTALAPPTKRAVWAAIQTERPALAELLSSSPFRALVERFEGRVYVDRAELPETALQALREAWRA